MIGAAEGAHEAVPIIKLYIIPPGERVGAEVLEQTKEREEDGDREDHIDQLTELRPCSYGVDDQVEDHQISQKESEGPDAGLLMKRKNNGHNGQDDQDDDRFVQRGLDPFPFPGKALVQEKKGESEQGDHFDNGDGPGLDRTASQRGDG